MKGQLSLEFLIITVIFTACLLILTPSIIALEKTASYSLKMSNARNALDAVYFSCERAKITGEIQETRINALGEYLIFSDSNSVFLKFDDRLISRETSFECFKEIHLKKGFNQVNISPNST